MTNENSEEIQSYLDQLVGEGKKYRDVEELAKGTFHANNFIEVLKKEKEQMQEQLQQSQTIADLLNFAPQQTTNQSESTLIAAPVETPKEDVKVQERNVEEIVQELLERKNQEQNQRIAYQKVLDYFGKDEQKAGEYIRQKSADLGLPVSWFDDVARKNPNALVSILGIDKPSSPTPQLNPTINPAAVGTFQAGEQVKDHAYYQKLRRENPRLYNSPQIQQEKERSILSLGMDRYLGKQR